MIVDRKVSIEISEPAEAIFVKKMLVTHPKAEGTAACEKPKRCSFQAGTGCDAVEKLGTWASDDC